MNLRPLLLLLFCGVMLAVAGCAPKQLCPPLSFERQDAWSSLQDLQTIPQDPLFHARQLEGSWTPPAPETLQAEHKKYLERLLAPWRQTKSGYPPDQAFWSIASYGGKQGYGENLRPRAAEWFQAQVRAMQTEAFPSLARRAVAVRNTALRGMPTQRPFFLDPREAGEGFPFDYFQNSALWVGTPVFVSHQSRDGAWLFAEAPFAAGWVPAQDLAFVDAATVATYQQDAFVAVLQDDSPVRDLDGNHLFTAHLGTLLPRCTGGGDAAICAPVRDANGQARLVPARLPTESAANFPLPFAPEAVARLAAGVMGQAYGWGGMYENRDCSALVRDLFTPFGIWLPRNSKPQAQTGRSTPLDGLEPAAKERRLLEQGVPFRTLVGMPGHIMLYLGEYQGRAVVLHSIWGLRTEDECGNAGRQIIGRTVITTLTPGLEHPQVRRSGKGLLQRVNALAVLAEP